MNPEKWKTIDPTSPDAVGVAYSRFSSLLRQDPFTSFFSREVQESIAVLVFSPACLAHEAVASSALKIGPDFTSETVRTLVTEVLDQSALALLLTDSFKAHVGTLAAQAIMGGSFA